MVIDRWRITGSHWYQNQNQSVLTNIKLLETWHILAILRPYATQYMCDGVSRQRQCLVFYAAYRSYSWFNFSLRFVRIASTTRSTVRFFFSSYNLALGSASDLLRFSVPSYAFLVPPTVDTLQ